MNAVIAHDMRVLVALAALAVLVALGLCTGALDDSAEYQRRAAWEAEVSRTDWVMW